MIELSDRSLFTPVRGAHAQSGVTIYVLNRKVAPVQQSFYFTNDGMSADGRYLWFYCAFPPSGSADQGRTLGVVDFVDHAVRHFPETQFTDASPYVDHATGDAYWGMGAHLWRRSPASNGHVEHINALPDAIIGARAVPTLATHLTRSADGKAFFADARIGLQYVFGSLPVDGSPWQEWMRFDRYHNHAQFSPTDPDTVLFAQEMHDDPLTGLTFPITNRLWLMRRGEIPRAILKEPRWVSHEWWDANGRHVWCVWENETWRVDIETGEEERIAFPRRCWHSHSSRDGQMIVGDSNSGFRRGCPSTLHFMNRHTGRVITLVENPERSDYTGRTYHIDPHPRFCCADQYIVFTTTILGDVDVAIIPVSELVSLTSH